MPAVQYLHLQMAPKVLCKYLLSFLLFFHCLKAQKGYRLTLTRGCNNVLRRVNITFILIFYMYNLELEAVHCSFLIVLTECEGSIWVSFVIKNLKKEKAAAEEEI